MPWLQQSLCTKAPGREIQIIITARQFHYLGEGYVALAHIGCLPCVKEREREEEWGPRLALCGDGKKGGYYPTLSWWPLLLK